MIPYQLNPTFLIGNDFSETRKMSTQTKKNTETKKKTEVNPEAGNEASESINSENKTQDTPKSSMLLSEVKFEPNQIAEIVKCGKIFTARCIFKFVPSVVDHFIKEGAKLLGISETPLRHTILVFEEK